MRYRLYVDESGDHTYKNLEDVGHKYLGLVGVAIESEYYRTKFQPDLEQLKQKHFPHNPDEPVILHREDIYNKRHPFGVLADPEKNELWKTDFLQFIKTSEFRLFCIVLDKKNHKERYGNAAIHPYNLCLTFLLERYKGFLTFKNSKGDVLAESRGKNEDLELGEVYKDVWQRGTYYNSAKSFQSVLTSKELKLKRKIANIGGLQIADLMAHPAKMDLLYSRGKIVWEPCFGKDLTEAFRQKYDLIGRKLFD